MVLYDGNLLYDQMVLYDGNLLYDQMLLYDDNLLYDQMFLYYDNLLYDKRFLYDNNLIDGKWSYVQVIVLYENRCAHSLFSFEYNMSHTKIVIFGAF